MAKLIFLHGAPASGKLTVAKALLRALPGRLFDNHAAIDLARTLFDFGAPGFWKLVHTVRMAALEAAAEHGAPLVVSTFCYSEPEDRVLFEQFETILTNHGGHVLPVFLRCSEEEARRRVGNADRVERRKIISAQGLADFAERWNMAAVPRANCLGLDTETEEPDLVARKVIRHFALAVSNPFKFFTPSPFSGSANAASVNAGLPNVIRSSLGGTASAYSPSSGPSCGCH